jgi:hypothetical protein
MTSLATLLLILLWIGGSILLVAGTCHGVRWLLPPAPDHADPEGHHCPLSVRDMSATAGWRIAALDGIMLALVYAQELRGDQEVRAGLGREAVAVSQARFDAGRDGGASAPAIPAALGNMKQVADLRQMREEQAADSFSEMFWLPAVAGMVLVTAPFFPFPPRR